MSEYLRSFALVAVAAGILKFILPKNGISKTVGIIISLVSVLAVIGLFTATTSDISDYGRFEYESTVPSGEAALIDSVKSATCDEVRLLCAEYTGVFPDNVDIGCYASSDGCVIEYIKVYAESTDGLINYLKEELSFENIVYGGTDDAA